ncbi:unnamed protein product, partial [Timema podura]|nr:unnamed protein product [Timema podura]
MTYMFEYPQFVCLLCRTLPEVPVAATEAPPRPPVAVVSMITHVHHRLCLKMGVKNDPEHKTGYLSENLIPSGCFGRLSPVRFVRVRRGTTHGEVEEDVVSVEYLSCSYLATVALTNK